MNSEQLKSAVRAILHFVGGALIAHGTMDGGTWEIVGGSLSAIIGALWSYFRHETPPTTEGTK